MTSRTLDLRSGGKSCTDHPVYALATRIRASREEGVAELTVLVNPSDLPLEVVEMYLKSAGYAMVRVERVEDWLRIEARRAGGGG
ncbi:MAG: hypothetical protein QXU97_00935 [Fervidicoccaceae archaeon]